MHDHPDVAIELGTESNPRTGRGSAIFLDQCSRFVIDVNIKILNVFIPSDEKDVVDALLNREREFLFCSRSVHAIGNGKWIIGSGRIVEGHAVGIIFGERDILSVGGPPEKKRGCNNG